MSWLIYTSSHKIPLLFNYNIGLNLPGRIVVNQELKLPTQSSPLVPRDDLCSLHDIFNNFLIGILSVCFYSLVAYRPYHTLLWLHEFSLISWVGVWRHLSLKFLFYSARSWSLYKSKYVQVQIYVRYLYIYVQDIVKNTCLGQSMQAKNTFLRIVLIPYMSNCMFIHLSGSF